MAEILMPSFAQVPYSALAHRMESGTKGLYGLANLLVEKKELLENDISYSLKVSKTTVYEHEIAASTSERLLGFYKNYHMYVSKAQIKHRKEFSAQILHQLEELKQNRLSNLNRQKDAVQMHIKEVAAARDNLEKSKRAFQRAQQDYQKSIEKLELAERNVQEMHRQMEEKARDPNAPGKEKFSMGRMFSAFESNPEQEREKQLKKVEKRRMEMLQASQSILDRKKMLLQAIAGLDASYEQATQVYENLELERMNVLQSTFRTFCQLERTSLTKQLDLLKTLEEAVTHHQPVEDLTLYITQLRQPEQTHRYSEALKLLDESFLYRAKGDRASDVATETKSLEKVVESPASPAIDAVAGSSQSVADLTEQHIGEDKDEVAQRDSIPERPQDDPEERGTLGPSDLSAYIRQLEELLDRIFTPIHATSEGQEQMEASLPTESEWQEVFKEKDCRDLFLKELDRRRGKNASIKMASFVSMSSAMKAFLDHCDLHGDIMSAMRISNMANTFHSSGTAAAGNGESGDGDKRISLHELRTYLQSDPKLRNHPIWSNPGFWESALRESVLVELSRLPILSWDDLSAEELRECVIAVHNVIFGQLGSLSFAMTQQGVDKQEVADRIAAMGRQMQLPEELEFQLVASITGRRVKEYIPPSPILVGQSDVVVAGVIVDVKDNQVASNSSGLSREEGGEAGVGEQPRGEDTSDLSTKASDILQRFRLGSKKTKLADDLAVV